MMQQQLEGTDPFTADEQAHSNMASAPTQNNALGQGFGQQQNQNDFFSLQQNN